jgi:hypothetical protein
MEFGHTGKKEMMSLIPLSPSFPDYIRIFTLVINNDETGTIKIDGSCFRIGMTIK